MKLTTYKHMSSQYVRPALRTGRGCHGTPRTLSPEDRQKLLRSPPPKPVRQTVWTAPVEYLMVARDMHPPCVAEAYIARCEAWFEAQPPRRVSDPARREVVDAEAVLALISKYGAYVPLEEYRRVGYSEEALENVRRHREWVAAHADELQAEIDRRWPGSSKPKPVKKVIKAVKKKMI